MRKLRQSDLRGLLKAIQLIIVGTGFETIPTGFRIHPFNHYKSQTAIKAEKPIIV